MIRRNIDDARIVGELKLVTLTLRHEKEGLDLMLDRLLKAFRKLRSKPCWKKNISGGMSVVEVKKNPETGRWHAHIHCLVRGCFVAQSMLSNAWLDVTGTSKIVDIRAVRSMDAALTYVLKYMTKPTRDYDEWLPSDLDHYISAVQSRKLLITFGTWRKLHLTKPRSSGEWSHYGTLSYMAKLAAKGDELAWQALHMSRFFLDEVTSAVEWHYRERPEPISIDLHPMDPTGADPPCEQLPIPFP